MLLCNVTEIDFLEYIIILLPYLGLHSNHVAKLLNPVCTNSALVSTSKVIFQNTRSIESYFPHKDRLSRSQLQMSKIIYKAGCWDCNKFYIGKKKRRLHGRKTEHFKALTKSENTSAIADHIKTTGHNINWDHFDILASGKTDFIVK